MNALKVHRATCKTSPKFQRAEIKGSKRGKKIISQKSLTEVILAIWDKNRAIKKFRITQIVILNRFEYCENNREHWQDQMTGPCLREVYFCYEWLNEKILLARRKGERKLTVKDETVYHGRLLARKHKFWRWKKELHYDHVFPFMFRFSKIHTFEGN